MIKSMTGYGRVKKQVGDYDITAEIKSVNNRYQDITIRIPKLYGFLEDKIREITGKYAKRGKIEIYISIDNKKESAKTISLNKPYAENYFNVLCEIAESFKIPNDTTVSTFSRNPDIFTYEQCEQDEQAVLSALTEVLEEVLPLYLQMCQNEGERLKADILDKLSGIRSLVSEIEAIAPQTVTEYQERLQTRMKQLLEGYDIDEQRILTEVAVFADKVAIDEEITRLGSHLAEFTAIVTEGGSVGKKLDFVVQEMNREINTIGSKCNNQDISKIVINVKAEIEKIREQIQNIE